MTNRALTLAVAVSLVVGAPLHAAVLCAKKKGGLSVRDVCRKKETQVDPAALGLVGPQGPPGPQGPAGNALSGTPHRQHLTSPAGFLTDSTFTTGAMLTDVVFFRFNDSNTAVCSIVDTAGQITSTVVPGSGHVQLSFATPIVVSGTLAAGCNSGNPAQILLVGTTP